jgi:hypothetical protein
LVKAASNSADLRLSLMAQLSLAMIAAGVAAAATTPVLAAD